MERAAQAPVVEIGAVVELRAAKRRHHGDPGRLAGEQRALAGWIEEMRVHHIDGMPPEQLADGPLDRRHAEHAATVDCRYCMPYEDDKPIWIARNLRRPVAETWPSVKHYD